MKYTLFLYNDETRLAAMPKEAFPAFKAAFENYTKSLVEAGVFVSTDWLSPSSSGTVLTIKDGARRVQDGPYAATKEQLGGFYVIDVANLDAALQWAERCPAAAAGGLVEIRPSRMG
jgi:hypothetical protein